MEFLIKLVFSYLIPFVFVLGLLIVIHELGHFLLAKLTGIRVERFSIGFPPRLFGKKIGDTDYCISAVPMGGYVKMSGMIDESMDAGSINGEPYEFMSKPIWVRMLVILAGPLFNVLLAVLIFAASFYITGIAEPVGPVVGKVVENMPAQTAGLQPGDIVRSIDGKPVSTWEELVALVHAAPEKSITMLLQRGSETLTVQMTPTLEKIQNIGLVGIEPKTISRKPGLISAAGMGIGSAYRLTILVFKSFAMLFTGQVSLKEGLAGPVRIAQMAGDSAKGGFGSLLMFAAFLSLNLGILNVLPIPVLDGGHLLFLAIEAIIRKPISVKIKLVVQQIGMALLLALMLFVIFNDFSHIF
jgi:regulator of sigma E protease